MSSTTAIKITAHIGDGIVVTLADAFEDIERAIDIFNDLAEKDEDLDFATVEVEIEHVEGDGENLSEQMKWLTWYFKVGEEYTLDMVVSELEDMNTTLESLEGDAEVFDAYCACYGAHYLTPGDRISFSTYSRREMIEREIEDLCLSTVTLDKIRHLLDEDALLAQGEGAENAVEMGGSYYVFN